MKRTRNPSALILQEHRRLIHELEVHKVELEMQNQSLREGRQELEQSHSRYAQLYDLAPVGHLTMDASAVIEDLNLACAALLGRERRSLQGKRLGALVAPESRDALAAHVRACFKSSGPVMVELMVPSTKGGLRPVELVSVASPGMGGLHSFYSVMTDVSVRKRETAERELLLQRERAARLLAEDLDRAKRDFLAVVSHELRTPLVPMMMWTKALRTGRMNDGLRLRAIDALDACIEAEVAMIDDLLDVARGLNGKLHVQRRAVDLQSLVAASLEALAPSIAAKQLALEFKVDPLPAWVTGDTVRLRQVVSNLLSNAVKFTREAGHVAVELRTRGDAVILTVRDDGEGITPELLPEIFKPFRQHDGGTQRRHAGLGLGLTIVHQLVEHHGGTVTAESEGKDRGAVFTVKLPRRQEAAPVEVAISPPSVELGLRDMQVLLVDDHAATREAMAIALEIQGAAITTAASAAEARAALERDRPHIILSDIGLPGEDGYEFVRWLRRSEAKVKGPRLPALAFTAHVDDDNRRLALEAGFDGHVAKPVDLERLVSVIGALARKPPAPRQTRRRERR